MQQGSTFLVQTSASTFNYYNSISGGIWNYIVLDLKSWGLKADLHSVVRN